MKSPALTAISEIFGVSPHRVTNIPASQELPSSQVIFMKRVNAWRAIIRCISMSVSVGGIFVLVCYSLSSPELRANSSAMTVSMIIIFAFISLGAGFQAWGYYHWFNFQDGIGPEVPDPKDWPNNA